MSKQLIFFCIFVAVASATRLGSIIDEATEQLEQLKSIVKGQILVAHDDLRNLDTAFKTFADDVYKQAMVGLQQEAGSIHSQLQTVKDLGHAAGKDISTCLKVREDFLNRLPAHYAERTTNCTRGLIRESEGLIKDGTYIVDISINKVHALEHQLANCKGEILCISPLLTEIELSKIRLPQSIKTEVQATESVLTTLKVSVQSCSNDNVAEYTTEAGTILGDIISCVDRIIN